MRIALVVPEYPPTIIGGGGVVFESLCRQYQLRHEVRIFSAEDSRRSWFAGRIREEIDQNCRVIRYPIIPMFQTDATLRSVLPPNLISAWNLEKDLKEWNPDVAHVHGIGYTFVDFASYYLRHLRIPYVLTDHGLPASFVERNYLIRSSYRQYHNLILRRTVSGAGSVTAVSSQEAETCAKAFRRQIITIPNGITPLPKETTIEGPDLHRVTGGKYIATAGRISPQKGFDVLLDALIDHPEIPPCVIAGDWNNSQYGRALHKRAGTRLIFVGPLSRAGLHSLFQGALLVVVPSRWEPFGLVGFEALAAGTRVVATRTGGLFDLEEKDAPVLLVQPESPVELAQGIMHSIYMGSFSNSETSACANILKRLDWKNVSTQYEAELNFLVQRNSK